MADSAANIEAPTAKAGSRTSPSELLSRAHELQKKGQLGEAAMLLEALERAEPENFAAWYAHGALAEQLQDWPLAVSRFAHAVALDPARGDIGFRYATSLFRAGRVPAAEAAARAHLALQPRDAGTLNLLGVICRTTGHIAEALDCFAQALKADKRMVHPHINAARIHSDASDFARALEGYRAALKTQPKNAEALAQSAWCHHKLGNSNQGLACCQQAILIDPRSGTAHANRGGILFELGRHAEALADLERAVELDPEGERNVSFLASCLNRLGRSGDAVTLLEAALARSPGNFGLLLGLGNAYFALDDLPRSNALLARAVEAEPTNIYAIARLCRSLLDSRYDDEAAHAIRASKLAWQAVESGRSLSAGFSEFQSVFQRTADFEGLRRLGEPWPILESNPGMHVSVLHSQLSQVVTPADRRRLLDLHCRWGERLALAAKATRIARPKRKPRKKLRIGVISSDLRSHAITYFAAPIVVHYDREQFELYCYSFYPGAADPYQTQIARTVDKFALLLNRSNEQIAQEIANDDLDMLFELGGSTKHNRLEVMAHRMAPLQASWLGYPHSAGLSSIDYILVDPYLKPPDPKLLVEKPFEMPESWVCFGGLGFPEVPIAEAPPADRNGGRITFGTLNNPYKFTGQCIAAWARCLDAVPGSRFLIVRPEAKSELFRSNVTREFARHGIAQDRVEFLHNTRGDHLALYNEIDIALDAFPQTGGTTTCETVWMGVPAVTLIGEAFFERLSYSNLSNAGLGDLCADTVDGYVARAAALARDLPRLRALRRDLRQQVRTSPLGQAERWVRNFEATVRSVVGRSAQA